MRWLGRRASAQVEDRRGGRSIGRRGFGLGCGGVVLVLLFSILTGQDPLQLLEVIGGGPPAASTQPPGPGASSSSDTQDAQKEFVSVVLADTEDIWGQLFTKMGRRYELPKLVLFSDAVPSACGYNSSAVGPFYCPADRKVYIDLSFFDQLHRQFGAPGDFAQAYVLAHEVGHHVQNLLGISDEVQRLRQRASQAQGNELSVRLELQADCLAGVFGYHNRRHLEAGDVEEGMRAAAAIGDDLIQRRSSGYVHPESWTHGSSEQRMRWLRRGLESGDPDVCETFEQRNL